LPPEAIMAVSFLLFTGIDTEQRVQRAIVYERGKNQQGGNNQDHDAESA